MNIIQIGANRGSDDLTEIIGNVQPAKFIIIEPMTVHNSKLEECYGWINNKIIENVAISVDDKKTIDFYYHANDGPGYEVASTDIDHITKHGYSTEGIISIKVPCVTINKILSKYNIKTLDILYIDAEGLDDSIIRSIDFDSYDIKNIYFEKLHLKTDIYSFLKYLGYNITESTGYQGWTSLGYK